MSLFKFINYFSDSYLFLQGRGCGICLMLVRFLQSMVIADSNLRSMLQKYLLKLFIVSLYCLLMTHL